jgi:hypothetical protein
MRRTMLRLAVLTAILASACSTRADDAGSDSANVTSAEEAPAVQTLHSMPAFAKLEAADKTALETLVRQPLNTVSKKARERLDALAKDSSFQALSISEQTKKLLALEAPLQTDVPYAQASGAFLMPLGDSDPSPSIGEPRITTRFGAPPPKDDAKFAAKFVAVLSPGPHAPETLIGADDLQDLPEPCAEYTVTFKEGDTVKVTAALVDGAAPDIAKDRLSPPDEDSAGQELQAPSVTFVARALAAIPVANRKILGQVDIHAKRNPQDKAAALAQGRKPSEVRAAGIAMVHPIGAIGIFPRKKSEPYDPVDLPQTLTHEGGHVWTYKRASLNPDTAQWKEWQEAIAADRLHVSWYSSLNFLEDSAETVLGLSAAAHLQDRQKAKAFYAEFKAMFPHRAAVIERYYPGFTPP